MTQKLSELSVPYDGNHGTFCAGIIAANANNGIGTAGAGNGWVRNLGAACDIIPIKVSSGLRNGAAYMTSLDVYYGMVQAVNCGARVISISIGGGDGIPGYRDLCQQAANYAQCANVVIVASAGNNNNSANNYPATIDSVIAVGGTDESNQKSSFSSYGSWVDIVVPSTNFVSTDTANDTAVTYGAGTSFATPLVASTAALMLAVNPSLTPAQVKNIIAASATYIGSPYFNCGMLNAGLATQMAKYECFKGSTVKLSKAEAVSAKKIRITWDSLYVYGPEIVEIYRSTSKNGTYRHIKTLDSIKGKYTDSGLKKDTKYFYKVRIGMKYGAGYQYTPFSNIKSAKTTK